MEVRGRLLRWRCLYGNIGRRLGAMCVAPSEGQLRLALFVLGTGLLIGGLSNVSLAADNYGEGLTAVYSPDRIDQSLEMLLTFIEGSFGALVMAAAGLGAILSSAFGQYKSALGCLIVAVGAFILRSFMETFFNMEGLRNRGA